MLYNWNEIPQYSDIYHVDVTWPEGIVDRSSHQSLDDAECDAKCARNFLPPSHGKATTVITHQVHPRY